MTLSRSNSRRSEPGIFDNHLAAAPLEEPTCHASRNVGRIDCQTFETITSFRMPWWCWVYASLTQQVVGSIDVRRIIFAKLKIHAERYGNVVLVPNPMGCV